jgi:hypothetical protein
MTMPERFFKPSMTMINDNDAVEKSDKVEAKAEEIARLFGSPASFSFYCKQIYDLGFETVDNLVEKTLSRNPRPQNPSAYFNVLCKKELRKRYGGK